MLSRDPGSVKSLAKYPFTLAGTVSRGSIEVVDPNFDGTANRRDHSFTLRTVNG